MGSPAAAAISTTAVSPMRAYAASTGSSHGPVTGTVTRWPPTASRKQSTVPSPPSATGRPVTRQPGICSAKQPAAIRAASALPSVPLNESVMTKTFRNSIRASLPAGLSR